MPPQKEIALIRHVYVPIGNNMKTTLTTTAFDDVKRDSGLFYVLFADEVAIAFPQVHYDNCLYFIAC